MNNFLITILPPPSTMVMKEYITQGLSEKLRCFKDDIDRYRFPILEYQDLNVYILNCSENCPKN